MKQNTPYLQGHWDYFHGHKGPQEQKNREYMRGWLDAYKKGQNINARKQAKRANKKVVSV